MKEPSTTRVRPPARMRHLVALAGALVLAVIGLGRWCLLDAFFRGAAVGLAIYCAIQLIAHLRIRLTIWRAAALLRRQRGTGNRKTTWSAKDWEWALTRLGTRAALSEAARCRMAQNDAPRGPGQAGR